MGPKRKCSDDMVTVVYPYLWLFTGRSDQHLAATATGRDIAKSLKALWEYSRGLSIWKNAKKVWEQLFVAFFLQVSWIRHVGLANDAKTNQALTDTPGERQRHMHWVFQAVLEFRGRFCVATLSDNTSEVPCNLWSHSYLNKFHQTSII